MKERMAPIYNVMSAEQDISITTVLSDLIVGEKTILEKTGMKEEIKKEAQVWVKKVFGLKDKDQKIIDNEDEAKGFDRYGIYENFRNQMDIFGLVGSLKNMSLTQVEDVNKIKKYQYFKGKYLQDAKVLVMSADYQLNGVQKGRVHKLFVFRKSYPSRFPVFDSPQFIELPESVQADLRGGRVTKWNNIKNKFEKTSESDEDKRVSVLVKLIINDEL